MLTNQAEDVVRQVRSGVLDKMLKVFLEEASAVEFVADLHAVYPVVFQERSIGRKREIGMASEVRLESAKTRSLPASPSLHLVLSKCVFVSSYGDKIGEITTTNKVRVLPDSPRATAFELEVSSASKLDRTPDGWVVKRLAKHATVLSGKLLKERGWRPDALPTAWPKP
jgi:hypothetical protein